MTGRGSGDGRPVDDSGLATVWAALAVSVLVGVMVAMLDLGGAVTARHRAEAAADLAALAAAGLAARGEGVACARAAAVASADGARLTGCRLQSWEVLVEVETGVSLSLLGSVTVRGRARAGPTAAEPPIPPSPPKPTVKASS